MAFESLIQELIDAVKENTAAHAQLGEIAKAAAGKPAGKASTASKKTETEDDGEDEAAKKAEAAAKRKAAAEKKKADEAAAEKKKADEAAKKKAAAEKKKAADTPELPGTVDTADLRGLARTFMSKDNENRDENKEKFAAALDHLGAENLSGVSEEDQARLFGYITYWSAGLDVDFEAVDEIVAAAAPDEDAGEEDDDSMLD